MAGINEVHTHPPEDAAEISVADSSEASWQNTWATADTDSADESVKKILYDSKMREILMDSKIQQLMTHLRTDPDKAQM